MLKRSMSLIFIFLLLFQLNSKAEAASSKVVVININIITSMDFFSNPYFNNLARNSSIGLINSKSNGRGNQYKPYVTLGSGQKGEVTFECLECSKADKNVIEQYNDLTLNPCIENNIVNLYINRLNYINSNTLYNAKPGLLGTILKTNNISTGFIGGFWFENSIKSPAFFIAMDNKGIVDFGEVNEVFENNNISQKRLIEAFNKYKSICDFIVIELGDMESLYANKRFYSDESYEVNKQRILNEAGEAIELIKNSIDFTNAVLYVTVPYSLDTSHTIENSKEQLSPLLIYDGGINKGIITSNTTRRQGIVSVLDFAPSILNNFGITSANFVGYPVKYIPVSNNVEHILELDNNILSVSESRAPILKGYALFIIALIIIYIISAIKASKKGLKIIFFLMQYCLIIPFFMLLEGLLKLDNIVLKVLFIFISGFFLTFFINKLLKHELDKLITITSLNTVILLIDLLLNQYMLKYSVFSYDPIIGARFYGIGNEYLGVLVGSSIVLFGCILEKGRKYRTVLSVGLAIIMLVTGLPSLGANAGGFITCAIGFAILIFLEYGHSLKKAIKLSAVCFLMLFCLYAVINVISNDNKSHVGTLFEQIHINGISYFNNIVMRKIDMSLRLIKYTIWSKVLIFLIIAAIMIISKPYGYVKRIILNVPHLKNSWISAFIAGVIALLSNDSGIVTAAIIMISTVFSMILILHTFD